MFILELPQYGAKPRVRVLIEMGVSIDVYGRACFSVVHGESIVSVAEAVVNGGPCPEQVRFAETAWWTLSLCEPDKPWHGGLAMVKPATQRTHTGKE